MTVIGVGFDLVDVDAFCEQLRVEGSGFASGAFTAAERAGVGPLGPPSMPDPVAVRRLAARYAAKEAFVKAWSASRPGSPPLLERWELSHVEVVTDPWGRPSLRLLGAVAEQVGAQLGERWAAHVSLSHDGAVAGATVVLEVAP